MESNLGQAYIQGCGHIYWNMADLVVSFVSKIYSLLTAHRLVSWPLPTFMLEYHQASFYTGLVQAIQLCNFVCTMFLSCKDLSYSSLPKLLLAHTLLPPPSQWFLVGGRDCDALVPLMTKHSTFSALLLFVSFYINHIHHIKKLSWLCTRNILIGGYDYMNSDSLILHLFRKIIVVNSPLGQINSPTMASCSDYNVRLVFPSVELAWNQIQSWLSPYWSFLKLSVFTTGYGCSTVPPGLLKLTRGKKACLSVPTDFSKVCGVFSNSVSPLSSGGQPRARAIACIVSHVCISLENPLPTTQREVSYIQQ